MPDLEGKKLETKLVKPETLIFHAVRHQKLRTGMGWWGGARRSSSPTSLRKGSPGLSSGFRGRFLADSQPPPSPPATRSPMKSPRAGLAVRRGRGVTHR